MKLKMLSLLFLLTGMFFDSPAQAYQEGEFLKFRIHYFFVNAGYATLKLEKTVLAGKPVYHAIGKGKSSSFSALVMKINDVYESYFDEQNRPLRFIRNIQEGNYRKNVEYIFHHDTRTLQVIDKLRNEVKTFKVPPGIQDLVSVYYAMRNVDTSQLKPGDFISQDIFFDEKVHHFKMKILGREIIKTKFGYTRALVLRPYVVADRVFREEESLTVWVSDDENKIPLLIEAKLLVGSIKADLVKYKNLKYPIRFTKHRSDWE
ncbi:MAG: DUF3108 domain-containing protein [Chlorobi bacterium]|nr:DUF3108 domain-containing protein [Chlorobiota bacterium]